jgi:hypothetical protein
MVAMSSCTDATEPAVFDEAEITADIAASAGEAIATALNVMVANESGAALSTAQSHHGGHGPGEHSVDVQRTRTCYDANDAVVADCTPFASVRMIVTHAEIDGNRGDTRVNARGETVTWSGAVHRVMDDTLRRVFDSADPPAETARIHNGVASANDTTTFSSGTRSRTASETATDSVRALTWNLPRSTNPWPVSGSIVRRTAVDVTVTDGDRTEARALSRRIEVTFPADAQGNVQITIDDRTCVLNLVTRRVTSCE